MRTLMSFALCLAVLVPAGVFAQSSNIIEYRERATIAVGQSIVIHGARGECGQAPSKSSISLPKLKTGTLSLGKSGVRDSNSCGGNTPAIEVIFTGTIAGRESFELFGDKVTLRVK